MTVVGVQANREAGPYILVIETRMYCPLPETRVTSFTVKVTSTPAVFVFVTNHTNANLLPALHSEQ